MATNLTDLFLLGIFAVLGIVLLYKVYVMRLHILIARDPTNNTNYARQFHCKEVHKRDGSVWWVSFPMRTIMTPAPPSEAVDITTGGRKWAEGYQLSRDQFVWIKDTGLKGTKAKEVLEGLQPFTTTDREVLVHEFEKAEAEKKKKLLSPEFILPMTAVIMMGLVLVAVIVFWSDLAKPLITMADKNDAFLEKNRQLTALQVKIAQGLGVKLGFDVPQELLQQQGQATTISETETPPQVLK